MSTTQAPPKRPKEQIAQHVYPTIPKRASAPKPKQAPPSASVHGAGHYSGIQPEDRPYTTAEIKTWKARAPQDEDAYEEVEIDPKRLPSSARRYHRLPAAPEKGTHLLPKQKGHTKRFYVLIIGSSIIVGVILANVIPYLWQHGSDQLHYGYPRTYQTDVNVGHYPTAKDPRSHFIALNNQGYIEVIELPEGVPSKPEEMHLYFISLPANAAADQAPVTLDFEDVNGDHKLDMEVSCNNNKTILYNSGQAFQPKP